MPIHDTDAADVLLDCQSVWKIFGTKSQAAMKAVRERDLSKKQVLQEFNCVIGVCDASLQVGRGEILCIMGLSGSGKSTLIRMLNRLIAPTIGRITVKGRDLASLNDGELREMRARHIGMVFQSVALLPQRTVLENAAFGLEVRGVPRAEREKTARAALEKVGLADWTARFPRQLSGGMQQRVGLARALAADPEIILMDEPFSALDPLIRRQLQDEFRQLTKELGKSAVFITHDLDEAIRIGDRIAIMKDGVIVQVGTSEEIVLNPQDEYVAEFVAGISRLHLVKAHSLMTPLTAVARLHPGLDVGALPRVPPGADIDTLIAMVMPQRHDAVLVAEGDQVLGVVTLRSILKGVSGQGDPAETPVPHTATEHAVA